MDHLKQITKRFGTEYFQIKSEEQIKNLTFKKFNVIKYCSYFKLLFKKIKVVGAYSKHHHSQHKNSFTWQAFS